jgi:hypothetical protein
VTAPNGKKVIAPEVELTHKDETSYELYRATYPYDREKSDPETKAASLSIPASGDLVRPCQSLLKYPAVRVDRFLRCGPV